MAASLSFVMFPKYIYNFHKKESATNMKLYILIDITCDQEKGGAETEQKLDFLHHTESS